MHGFNDFNRTSPCWQNNRAISVSQMFKKENELLYNEYCF